ncbi:MAG: alanine racemase [Oscillospiraceae bacterium]|nr:alanine racemase [Oscillospiraceae bacterium]
MTILRRCWAEISLDALRHNFNIIQSLAQGAGVMAIVKADGYGHGDVQTARLFANAGAEWLGVSSMEEALHLRAAKIETPILILGYTPPNQLGALHSEQLTQTVFSPEYAQALSAAAAEKGLTLDVHIKVDTGMGRLGFDASCPEAVEQILQATRLKGLCVSGIFTHFSVADSISADNIAYTERQHRLFNETVAALVHAGARFSAVHCCNSAGLAAFGAYGHTLVRPGIILYGENPSDEIQIDGLIPAMALKAVVSHVKTLPAGRDVSYGRSYTTAHATKVATLTVGYADGYPRAMSGKGMVTINGVACPVIGKVCMDQMMVDVSALEAVCPGDTAVIFGPNCANSASDIAALAGTVAYEILCGINRRVPRVYTENGAEVCCVDYLAQTPVQAQRIFFD